MSQEAKQFGLGLVGATIGFFIGGPGGAALGFSIGMTAGQFIFPITIDGPRITETKITQSAYGVPIPMMWGRAIIGGNIIQTLQPRETTSTSSGGKGVKIKTFEVWQTFLVSVCEGVVLRLKKVWADEELVFDEDGTTIDEQWAFFWSLKLYTGTENQQPDPTFEADVGVGNQSSYRGQAYVFSFDFPTHKFGGRIPQFKFLIEGANDPILSTENFHPLIQNLLPNDEDGGSQASPFDTDGRWIQPIQIWKDTIEPNRTYVHILWDQEYYSSSVMAYYDGKPKPGVDPTHWNRVSYDGISYDDGLNTNGTGPFCVSSGGNRKLFVAHTGTNHKTLCWMVHLDATTLNFRGKSKDMDAVYTGIGTGNFNHTYDIISDKNGRVCAALGGYDNDNGGFLFFYYPRIAFGAEDTYVFDAIDLGFPFGTPSDLAIVWSICFAEDQAQNFWTAGSEGVTLSNDNATEYLDRFEHKISVISGADPANMPHLDRYTLSRPPDHSHSSVAPKVIGMYFKTDTNELMLLWEGRRAGSVFHTHWINSFSLSSFTQSSVFHRWKVEEFQPFNGSYWHWRGDFVGKQTDTWLHGTVIGWNQDNGSPTTFPLDGVYMLDINSGEEDYFSLAEFGLQHATDDGVLGNSFLHYGTCQTDQFTKVVWCNNYNWDWYEDEDDFRSKYQGIFIFKPYTSVAAPVILQTVIEDVIENVDDTFTSYSFSTQTQLVWSYLLETRMPARSAISALRPAYFFDLIESDGLIQGINRGGSVVLTINEDDLGVTDSRDAKTDRLEITRMNTAEMPSWIDYAYIDIDHDYQKDSVAVRLPGGTFDTALRATVEVPVGLTKQQAIDAAKRFLQATRDEIESYEFTTWLTYIKLEPADIIQVSHHSRLYRIRLEEISIGANYILQFKGKSESGDAQPYTVVGTPNNPIGGFIPGVGISAFVQPKVLIADTALLQSSDDTAGLYATAGPMNQAGNFAGADILKAPTETGTFTSKGLTTLGAIYGNTFDPLLAPVDWTVWDDVNLVDIVGPIAGVLTAQTKNALLDDPALNLALVGDELIQFGAVNQVAANRVEVSTLLRGRLGTELHIDTHEVGDQFLLIDAATLISATYPVGEIGTTKYYKAIGGGPEPESIVLEVLQTTRRLLCYAPYNVLGSRDGSENLTITWLRRSRVPGQYLQSSPLFEEFENYEVDIFDGADIVRTIAVTAETASYSAADQTTDFGSEQAAITIRIYQLNAIVGRGYHREAVV